MLKLLGIFILLIIILIFFSKKTQEDKEKLTSTNLWSYYNPTCGDPWITNRQNNCDGLTTGSMPIIEECKIPRAPCCGFLGIQPPII